MIAKALGNHVPENVRSDLRALAETSIAFEEILNTGRMAWFVMDESVNAFFRRNRRNVFIWIPAGKKDPLHVKGMVMVQPVGKKRACISFLFVRPKYRAKGVGLRLVKEAVKAAKSLGRVPFLKVNPRNYKAIYLYKKIGFGFDPRQCVTMSPVCEATKK